MSCQNNGSSIAILDRSHGDLAVLYIQRRPQNFEKISQFYLTSLSWETFFKKIQAVSEYLNFRFRYNFLSVELRDAVRSFSACFPCFIMNFPFFLGRDPQLFS